MVEQKLLGTYRIALMEMQNPKCIYFVKNSGDFFLGVNKENSEIVVSTDIQVLKDMNFSFSQIPNNQLMEVGQDCHYEFTPLEKRIKIQRNPKALFDHIMHEEIYESIDAVDQATDFGDKFISNHQVVLGGFEKAKTELLQI